MLFKKLNIPLHFTSIEHTKDPFIWYGVEKNGVKLGSFFYRVLDNNVAESYKGIIHPDKRRFYSVCLAKINKPLGPHTDSNVKTNVNFYINAGNHRTVYYSIKNDVSYKGLNQTNGSMYFRENLEEIGSFTAHDQECWLLDVTKPHSVDAISNSEEERVILQLQTNFFTAEETLSFLQY